MTAAALEPVPTCPVCTDRKVCVYHACSTPEQLAALLAKRLKTAREGKPLEDYFAALLSGATAVPGAVLPLIAKQDLQAMVVRLEEGSSGELSALDFRALAGLALACAVVLEVAELEELRGEEVG